MTETAKEEMVRSCLRACEAFDAEGMIESFADEAVFWNAPIPPVRGKPQIKKLMERLFAACTSFETTVHHVASDQSAVFIERTDTINIRGVRVSAPVAGVVYFENDRIVAWRDYFDLFHLVRQLAVQSGRRVFELMSFGVPLKGRTRQ